MGSESLICPSCKEKNNPSFLKCWKCGKQIHETTGSSKESNGREEPPFTIAAREKIIGDILRPFFEEAFSADDFEYPVGSALGATPEYTFLHLLDKWFLFGTLKQFEYLKTPQEKYLFFINTRGYDDKALDILENKMVRNYLEAIMTIIDYEFACDNPADSGGLHYKSIRDELVQRFSQAEEAYKKKMNISVIG